IGVEAEVLTGMSGSRRDQPNEFIESLKDADAISAESKRRDDRRGGREESLERRPNAMQQRPATSREDYLEYQGGTRQVGRGQGLQGDLGAMRPRTRGLEDVSPGRGWTRLLGIYLPTLATDDELAYRSTSRCVK
ncbi:MAG: hypothetical protein M1825_003545, partial [Sarcosagium campestre]